MRARQLRMGKAMMGSERRVLVVRDGRPARLYDEQERDSVQMNSTYGSPDCM
jgi:hypothetical protein